MADAAAGMQSGEGEWSYWSSTSATIMSQLFHSDGTRCEDILGI